MSFRFGILKFFYPALVTVFDPLRGHCAHSRGPVPGHGSNGRDETRDGHGWRLFFREPAPPSRSRLTGASFDCGVGDDFSSKFLL